MEQTAAVIDGTQAEVQPVPVSKRRSRWLPHLSMVMLAEVALLLYLVPRDFALMDRIERAKDVYIRQPRRERRIRSAMQSDRIRGHPFY